MIAARVQRPGGAGAEQITVQHDFQRDSGAWILQPSGRACQANGRLQIDLPPPAILRETAGVQDKPFRNPVRDRKGTAAGVRKAQAYGQRHLQPKAVPVHTAVLLPGWIPAQKSVRYGKGRLRAVGKAA